MKKRILVTGGAGMIGSTLVKRLACSNAGEILVADNLWRGSKDYLFDNSGTPVIDMNRNFLELDLRDYEMCKRAVEGVDEVYHFADIVAGIKYVFANQSSLFHDNLLINANILKAAAEGGVKKFLYVGTACSYPQKMQFGLEAPPLKEGDVLPADPESAYGWSKLVGELQTDLYSKETEMETGIVRFHNVYGAPTDYSPERSQVIPSLISKAIRYPVDGFVVWGSGNQGRSFIHVDDVVAGTILAMEKGLGLGAIQFGTNYCTSIREIAETIVRISGKDIEIVYDTTKPEGDKGRCADVTKAETVLGWKQTVSLEKGLRQSYEWIERHMEKNKCLYRDNAVVI